ncbi:OB-fold nucleic acid binding domain-containing protein [Candidatus Woesearchaeota archaeon]|nr:OB-fold nucleic acid binding domain-containing protein [Candidatus Woesearchaeota archaeon]
MVFKGYWIYFFMQESTLLKLTLLSAVLGLIFLFFISKTIETGEGSLLEQDKTYLVRGTINRITERDSVTFIDLQKEDELTVVLFKDYPIDLHKGDYVEIKGTASEGLDGELQLIGKDVRVVK